MKIFNYQFQKAKILLLPLIFSSAIFSQEMNRISKRVTIDNIPQTKINGLKEEEQLQFRKSINEIVQLLSKDSRINNPPKNVCVKIHTEIESNAIKRPAWARIYTWIYQLNTNGTCSEFVNSSIEIIINDLNWIGSPLKEISGVQIYSIPSPKVHEGKYQNYFINSENNYLLTRKNENAFLPASEKQTELALLGENFDISLYPGMSKKQILETFMQEGIRLVIINPKLQGTGASKGTIHSLYLKDFDGVHSTESEDVFNYRRSIMEQFDWNALSKIVEP